MYQTITVAQHDLPKELLGLRIVLKYNSIDDSQPIIETSLDSEFGTTIISELLEEESLLLNEIRDVYFEIRDLKLKESINSLYTERLKWLRLKLIHEKRRSRFTNSFKNYIFWKKLGLTISQINRLCKIVKTVYMTTDWSYYIESKM